MVQVAHAAQECGLYLSTAAPDSDFIVICSVPDEAALLAEAGRHERIRVIREPDLGHRATAIASAPVSGKNRKPFRHWKLWLPTETADRPVGGRETAALADVSKPAAARSPVTEAAEGACSQAPQEVP